MATILAYPTYPAIHMLMRELFPQENWEIAMLGGGASNIAWHATSDRHSLVVRAVPPDPVTPATYAQEFAVSHMVYEAGFPVPEPVVTSAGPGAHHIPHVAFDWAVTAHAAGRPLRNNRLSVPNAHKIGTLLAYLHSIPVTGFGELTVTPDGLTGNQSTALAGARALWHQYPMWGIHRDVALESTVIASHFPELLAPLRSLEPDLHHYSGAGEAVICHRDLHNDHILLDDDGDLAAVIDFGAVCALPPAWDFAIAARYVGWRAVDDMLEAYTADTARRSNLRQHAYHLGLIYGIFRLQRQFLRNAPELVLARTQQFIMHTLNRLNQRS